LSKRPSRFTTSRYSASVLEHDGSDEERDHSNETVDEVHEIALVNSCERSLPVVNLTDALGNTPGAVHLLLQLHPGIVGHIVAADSIDQSFISCGFTTPGGFDLLLEFLQALLNLFRPGFILPFHKLALIRLFLHVTIVVSVTWSIGTPSCSDR